MDSWGWVAETLNGVIRHHILPPFEAVEALVRWTRHNQATVVHGVYATFKRMTHTILTSSTVAPTDAYICCITIWNLPTSCG